MTTAREIYDAYVSHCTSTGAKAKAFTSFKNKQAILDATTNTTNNISTSFVQADDEPVAPILHVEYDHEFNMPPAPTTITTTNEPVLTMPAKLTPKQRRILRDYASENPFAPINHKKNQRWHEVELPQDILKLILEA